MMPTNLLRALLLLAGLGASPALWAATCTTIFAPGEAGNGLSEGVPAGQVDLPEFLGGPVLTNANRTMAAGTSHWSGNAGGKNNWTLIAPTAGTARVLVKGNLTLGNSVLLNAAGQPENLVLFVDGDLVVGNSSNNILRGFFYATGNVTIGNNVKVEGAISAGKALTAGNNVVADYVPPAVVDDTVFEELCEPDPPLYLDHFRILHADNALTCTPLEVTLQACLNADCTQRHTDPVSVSLAPTGWVGGNLRSFSGGVADAQLRVTTPQTVQLGVLSSDPPLKASSQTLCNSGSGWSADCAVSFAESGFILDVPPLLARREAEAVLRAVRKDDASEQCAPAFGPGSARPVRFWSGYVAPASGTRAVQLNGTPLSGVTSIPLNFDEQATARLRVRYDDAGLMQLNARFDGSGVEDGQVLEGSAQFVSRPLELQFVMPAEASCTAATVAACSRLQAAGESFQLSVRALGWQNADETPEQRITPNFELDGITLTSTLHAPVGGDSGRFYRHDPDTDARGAPLDSYDHVTGDATILQVSQKEVGIFSLAAAGSYHGETVSGASGLIGRFTPFRLRVESDASLKSSCGTFSYQGQPIEFFGGQGAVLRVAGLNSHDEPTLNYDRGDFWRLAAPKREAYASPTGRPELNARLETVPEGATQQSAPLMDTGSADGAREFHWAEALRWRMAITPGDDDLPFLASSKFVQLRVLANQLKDTDGICLRSKDEPACLDFIHDFGGTELRLGRLRIDNARGAEDRPLNLPYWLESWRAGAGGGVWGPVLDDSCSLAALGTLVLDPPTFPSSGTLEAAPNAVPQPTGVLRLSAPNQKGSVWVSLSGLNGGAAPWLLFDWEGNGADLQAPRARALFGPRYQRPEVYRQEVLR